METSLQQFEYLADQVKLARYNQAMEKLVQPEHVVLDLGCGSGVIGLMALRAGARKVFFVDHGPVIDVARHVVADAGFTERAEFFQINSFELVLSEQVDIVVCDHVGFFGFDYGVLQFLADARQRFLKPDGATIPSKIELVLAPIESVACREFVSKWKNGAVPEEFSWLGTTAANTKHSAELKSQNLLANAASLATMELGSDVPLFLSWNSEFVCEKDGMLDGLAGWFDCQLFDDVHMTNSPTASEVLRRPQAVFPLESPVPVSPGEVINATVMARPLDNVIGWDVSLPQTNRRFSHNTFNGLELDAAALTRARPERLARINDRGRARQIVLSYCDGQRTVAEVQAMVRSEHPNLFPSAQATSSFVTNVLTWETSE